MYRYTCGRLWFWNSKASIETGGLGSQMLIHNARWIFGGRGGAYHWRWPLDPGTSNYKTSHYVPLNPSCRLFCTPIMKKIPITLQQSNMAREDPRFGVSGFPLPPRRLPTRLLEEPFQRRKRGPSFTVVWYFSSNSCRPQENQRKNHRKLGINQQKKGISPTMIVLVWRETGWNWLVFTAVF